MEFTVLRVPEVWRTVENELTKRERRAYDAAVEAVRGEGCRAGGKRLAAEDSGDYPMCQRSLYGVATGHGLSPRPQHRDRRCDAAHRSGDSVGQTR
jgi:hypothetical protein